MAMATIPARPAKATLEASRAPAAFLPLGGGTMEGDQWVVTGRPAEAVVVDTPTVMLLDMVAMTVTLERVMVLVTLSVRVHVVVTVSAAAKPAATRATREKRIFVVGGW